MKAYLAIVVLVAAECCAGASGWNFAAKFPEGGHSLRARWTVKHQFDIPEDGGISFDFSCSHPRLFSHITFSAARGDLSVPAMVEAADLKPCVTQRIYLTRRDFVLKDLIRDGKLPGGKMTDWSGFDMIRISTWRIASMPADVKVHIANIATFKGPPPVPVVPPPVAGSLVPPKCAERRFISCHRPYGVDEKSGWEKTARRMKACGFTDVLAKMGSPSGVYYRSDVLPVAEYVARHGDQLEACLKACRKHGLKFHACKVSFNLGRDCPKEYSDRMSKEGRLLVTAEGKELRRWLCPTHPGNIRDEVEAFAELSGRGVDGIRMDFIRYFGTDTCFCPRCRALFEAKTGAGEGWVKSLKRNPALLEKWDAFRCGNIAAVVKAISERVRKLHPEVEVSSAVFMGERILNIVRVGQDWQDWLEKGYVDHVSPMTYTRSKNTYLEMLERVKAHADTGRCYPYIGPSTWPWIDNPVKPARIIEQVNAVRENGFPGFSVFEFSEYSSKLCEKVFKERTSTGKAGKPASPAVK